MIQLPVTITDKNGTQDIFDSLTAAENSVEAIDVHSNEYRVHDSAGRELKIFVEKRKVSALFGMTEIETDIVRIAE